MFHGRAARERPWAQFRILRETRSGSRDEPFRLIHRRLSRDDSACARGRLAEPSKCAALYTLGNTLFWAHGLDEMQSTLEDVVGVLSAGTKAVACAL